MFLKNLDALIGPGNAIVLPEFTDPNVFHHEAELAIVIKGSAKNVKRSDWRKAVFGYTGIIDVSARAEGRFTWRQGSWMGKSFDTFAPVGPCITTTDEIGDPNKLRVRFFNNGDLYYDYVTDDMEHRVPELVEFASTIMTLRTGNVIACGTNHEGLGPLQDGEFCEIEVEKIGRMAVHVRDPLKRKWERSVYLGPASTNPAARRARGKECTRPPESQRAVATVSTSIPPASLRHPLDLPSRRALPSARTLHAPDQLGPAQDGDGGLHQ